MIEARSVPGAGEFPMLKMPARVLSLERAAPDVIVMQLQLPANRTFQYRAGQYVEFMLRDGARRSYSMANAPHNAGQRRRRSSCTCATCRAASSPTTCSAP